MKIDRRRLGRLAKQHFPDKSKLHKTMRKIWIQRFINHIKNKVK